jgi:hypothetical protein
MQRYVPSTRLWIVGPKWDVSDRANAQILVYRRSKTRSSKDAMPEWGVAGASNVHLTLTITGLSVEADRLLDPDVAALSCCLNTA